MENGEARTVTSSLMPKTGSEGVEGRVAYKVVSSEYGPRIPDAGRTQSRNGLLWCLLILKTLRIQLNL